MRQIPEKWNHTEATSHVYIPDLSEGDLRAAEIVHKSHEGKMGQSGLVFRDRNFFYLTKKTIEKFGESSSLCDWRPPHAPPPWKVLSEIHVLGGPWGPRASEINGTFVNTSLKYPMAHISFML